VVPGVMFLQAIGLPRDGLIQSMGILFTASTLALAIALQQNATAWRPLRRSAAPHHGQHDLGSADSTTVVRACLQEALFLFSLLALGDYIITSAFGAFQ
jgi:uncharacterized protein